MDTRIKKIALFGLLVALALILSYIEILIPIPFWVPGMKLGLANIVTLIALYKLGIRDAFFIAILRILLVSLLFGNAFSLAYSIAGGLLSLLVMSLMKKGDRFSIAGVSIAGGVCHNIAQVGVAAVIMSTAELAYYLPVLLITGSITGLLIGNLGKELLKKIKNVTI